MIRQVVVRRQDRTPIRMSSLLSSDYLKLSLANEKLKYLYMIGMVLGALVPTATSVRG